MRRLGPVVSHMDKHHEAHRAFLLSTVEATLAAAASRTNIIIIVGGSSRPSLALSICVAPALLFLLLSRPHVQLHHSRLSQSSGVKLAST